jgi:hypothetical protein
MHFAPATTMGYQQNVRTWNKIRLGSAEWTCFSHANVEDDDVLAVIEDVGLLEPQHREVGAFSDGLWHSTLWNRSKMMALSPPSMV